MNISQPWIDKAQRLKAYWLATMQHARWRHSNNSLQLRCQHRRNRFRCFQFPEWGASVEHWFTGVIPFKFRQYPYIGKIGLCSVLRPRQHSKGYMGDGFYGSKDPTNSIKVLKEMLQRKKQRTKTYKSQIWHTKRI